MLCLYIWLTHTSSLPKFYNLLLSARMREFICVCVLIFYCVICLNEIYPRAFQSSTKSFSDNFFLLVKILAFIFAVVCLQKKILVNCSQNTAALTELFCHCMLLVSFQDRILFSVKMLVKISGIIKFIQLVSKLSFDEILRS